MLWPWTANSFFCVVSFSSACCSCVASRWVCMGLCDVTLHGLGSFISIFLVLLLCLSFVSSPTCHRLSVTLKCETQSLEIRKPAIASVLSFDNLRSISKVSQTFCRCPIIVALKTHMKLVVTKTKEHNRNYLRVRVFAAKLTNYLSDLY